MAGEGYHNALMRRLSVIDGLGESARNNAEAFNRARMASQQSARAASFDQLAQEGQQRTAGGSGSWKSGRYNYTGSNDPIAFGRWLESQGFRVGEHPQFGNGRVGRHTNGSRHYSGRAYDVNWGPGGQSRAEQEQLAMIRAIAQQLGYQTIHMSPGHYGHLHVGW